MVDEDYEEVIEYQDKLNFPKLIFNQLAAIQRFINSQSYFMDPIELLGVQVKRMTDDKEKFLEQWNALIDKHEAGELSDKDLFLDCFDLALEQLDNKKMLYKALPHIKGEVDGPG